MSLIQTTGNKTPGQKKPETDRVQQGQRTVRCRGSLPLHCFAAIVLWLGPGMMKHPPEVAGPALRGPGIFVLTCSQSK